MDDNEIIAMSRGAESAVFERKESWRPDNGGPAICAFANDLADSKQPGVLLIGQKDNREYSGLTEAQVEEYSEKIPQIRDAISPFTPIQVRAIKIEEQMFIAVVVEPSTSPPVRYKKHIYVRTGSSTYVAKAEEEKKLQKKQEQLAKVSGFFDRLSPKPPPDMNDLDWDTIKRKYLPAAVSAETLEQNNRSREEQLASLRFLSTEGAPNHAAILCFHPEPRHYLPGAYIQFLRINGTDLSAPGADNMEMNGPVFYQLQQINDKLKAHISISFVIREDGRQEDADYPHAAIYQAVCNAVMHREYDGTNAPARCYWFSDRIEIHSPGGCFGEVSNENFGNSSIVDYRNPVLADALKHMGFVDKFGAGIPTIKRVMSENGNPAPIFTAKDNYTLITLPGKIHGN